MIKIYSTHKKNVVAIYFETLRFNQHKKNVVSIYFEITQMDNDNKLYLKEYTSQNLITKSLNTKPIKIWARTCRVPK